MTVVRVLTVCIGISDYTPFVLEGGEEPLAYLAQSAQDLSGCFSSGWPDRTSRHLVATGADATLERVRARLAAQLASYDLFVLYLGGHGRRAAGQFQFLFSGTSPQECVAPSLAIDALVQSVDSTCVLLLLDACFAGQHGEESWFFAPTEPAVVGGRRICISSSRADQKSWEDPKFQRSLFVDALIRALTVGADEGAGAPQTVNSVYRRVAADVTGHAFALKRSAGQEPVIFGSHQAVFELPLTQHGPRVRPMTTFEILRLRVRQILTGVIALTALALAVTSAATWRPAFNASGYVELRPGPKWLSALNVGPWATRVETDITEGDIKSSEEEPELKQRLLDERGMYLWPGVNAAGARRWVDPFVGSFLKPDVAARWRIRLGVGGAVDMLTKTIEPGGAGGLRVPILQPTQVPAFESSTELAAEARILSPTALLSDAWKVQWASNVVNASCDDEHPSQQTVDRVDIYLSSDPVAFTNWLRALEETSVADPAALGLNEVGALVSMFALANGIWRKEYTTTLGAPGEPITGARIAARLTERPTQGELSALTDLARAVNGRQLLANESRTGFLKVASSCGDAGMRVLAALGKNGHPTEVIAWAHGRSTSDQGRPALRMLAAQGALPGAEVRWVVETLGFFGDPTARRSAFVNAREWLASIATSMALPGDVVDAILSYAADRLAGGHEDDVRQAMAVIAPQAQALSSAQRQTVEAMLQKVVPTGNPLPTTKANLETLGVLSRGGFPLSPEYMRRLRVPIQDPEPWNPPEVVFTDNDRSAQVSTTRLVAGLTSTDVLAFARWVIGASRQTEQFDARRADRFLSKALSDALRFGVPARKLRDVVTADTIARETAGLSPADSSRILHNLRCCATDVAARRSEMEIGEVALTRLAPKEQEASLQTLRVFWRRETEPEVKLGLAEIIIRTAVGGQSNTPLITR